MDKKEEAHQTIAICQPKFHRILNSEKTTEFVPRSIVVRNSSNNNLNFIALNMSWADSPKTGALLDALRRMQG